MNLLIETNVLNVTGASCYGTRWKSIFVDGEQLLLQLLFTNGFNLLYDTVFSSLTVLCPVPGAGLYDILVNDANGCQASVDTTVGQPLR